MNQWFALDIEYVTWANPASQILHQGDPEEADPEFHRRLLEAIAAAAIFTIPLVVAWGAHWVFGGM